MKGVILRNCLCVNDAGEVAQRDRGRVKGSGPSIIINEGHV